MATRDPSKTLFDDIIKESKWARREIEKLWSLRSNADGAGVDYNKDNIFDANGVIGDYFHITPQGPGTGSIDAILLEVDTDGATNLRIQNNTDGNIKVENTGGAGIIFKNDGGIDPIFGYGLFFEDNGDGGIRFLSTTGGFFLDNFGGAFQLRNNDLGMILYSTGSLPDDTISDAPGGTNLQPGMVIAASDGIMFLQSSPTFNEGPSTDHTDAGSGTFFSNCYLYMDTGDFGILALWSPIVLSQTTDPGHPGMLWNDGGTVKIST